MSKKYDRLAWLKLVKVDPTLRPSVFKTAWEITQYVNVETGEFWAAALTIAKGGDHSDGIVMSEATVMQDMRKLVAAGLMEMLEKGRPGRGHSSRYRIVLKPQPAKVLKPQPSEVLQPAPLAAKTLVSPPENLRIEAIKPQPAKENHREPYLTIQSAAHAARSADVDRCPVTTVAPEVIAAAARAEQLARGRQFAKEQMQRESYNRDRVERDPLVTLASCSCIASPPLHPAQVTP